MLNAKVATTDGVCLLILVLLATSTQSKLNVM